MPAIFVTDEVLRFDKSNDTTPLKANIQYISVTKELSKFEKSIDLIGQL